MKETGADFTNTFRYLSKLKPSGCQGHKASADEAIKYILSQCATVEELKNGCKPQMDPRYTEKHYLSRLFTYPYTCLATDYDYINTLTGYSTWELRFPDK